MKNNEQELSEFQKQADQFKDSAFPVELTFQYQSIPGLLYKSTSKGLSKRELFAAMAMQGELASQSRETGEYLSNERNADTLAGRCRLFADALIKVLEEGK